MHLSDPNLNIQTWIRTESENYVYFTYYIYIWFEFIDFDLIGWNNINSINFIKKSREHNKKNIILKILK